MKTEFIFRRKERKYLINPILVEDLQKEMAKYLKPELYKNQNTVTCIRSYYFDSPWFQCYYDHLARKPERFKIRVRLYGYNGHFPKKGFLELKEKQGEETHKRRFKVTQSLGQRFMRGEDVFADILRYNSQIELSQLLRTYRTIVNRISQYQLEPLLLVEYRRECFLDKKLGIRITFDRDLIFRAFQNSSITPVRHCFFYPQNRVIMEVKTTDTRPPWLKNLLDRYGLRRQRFSKYCMAVESLYLSPKFMTNMSS